MIVYLDSLSHYNPFVVRAGGRFEQWEDTTTSTQTSFAIGAAYGRNGGGVRMMTNSTDNGSNNIFHKILPDAYQTVHVGVAIKLGSETSTGFVYTDAPIKNVNRQVITLMDGYVPQISLQVTPSGRLTVRRGQTGTVLARSAKYIHDDCFVYFEFGVFLHGSNGWIKVRVNGEEWSDLYVSGINTISSSNAQCTGVQLGNDAQNGGGLTASRFYYDDWYITAEVSGTEYNGFMGDIHIGAHSPSTISGAISWEPTSGTAHHSIINESQQTTTDVDNIRTNAPGATELFSLSSPSPSSGTILAVVPNLYARKDNAGVVRIAPVISDGVTSVAGTEMYLGQQYRYHNEQIMTKNPLANSQWPYSLSAIYAGVKKI